MSVRVGEEAQRSRGEDAMLGGRRGEERRDKQARGCGVVRSGCHVKGGRRYVVEGKSERLEGKGEKAKVGCERSGQCNGLWYADHERRESRESVGVRCQRRSHLGRRVG